MGLANKWIQGWLATKPYITNPKHPDFNLVIDNLVKDLNAGKNTINIVVGRARSGKSWFSLWLMCYMNFCYFGRSEYSPDEKNLAPLKDIYWDLKKFIRATLRSENWNKFIVLEEQGVERYKMMYKDSNVMNQDKLEQIFGIDMTNTINNLPYLFDIYKGARLKAQNIFVISRPSKNYFQLDYYKKWMNPTTEKAKFVYQFYKWKNLPNIAAKYPELAKKYEELKLEYNKRKKIELSGSEYENSEITGRETKEYDYKPISK